MFGKMTHMDHVILIQGKQLRKTKILTHVTNPEDPKQIKTITELTRMIGDDFLGRILRYEGQTLVQDESVSSLDSLDDVQAFNLEWGRLWTPSDREDLLAVTNREQNLDDGTI